ncbi:hypothetical protein N473_24690 [Pseudoalteromonas luteoviolacea CPMOR-1]|uniref:Uncharacterized protein n=1 Tax=Pseudoalteromonas luteoviolacea CPMOR-1 TaxID=1365248 RepID=A0A167IWX5_9GAMM|nr:hypothetical protein N473_24690 [Pseudoalteromonas luteoviolacea CPMOR-1]
MLVEVLNIYRLTNNLSSSHQQRLGSVLQKDINKMNKNIAVKDLKRVVAGINSRGDRGGTPASYCLMAKELQ